MKKELTLNQLPELYKFIGIFKSNFKNSGNSKFGMEITSIHNYLKSIPGAWDISFLGMFDLLKVYNQMLDYGKYLTSRRFLDKYNEQKKYFRIEKSKFIREVKSFKDLEFIKTKNEKYLKDTKLFNENIFQDLYLKYFKKEKELNELKERLQNKTDLIYYYSLLLEINPNSFKSELQRMTRYLKEESRKIDLQKSISSPKPIAPSNELKNINPEEISQNNKTIQEISSNDSLYTIVKIEKKITKLEKKLMFFEENKFDPTSLGEEFLIKYFDAKKLKIKNKIEKLYKKIGVKNPNIQTF